MALYLNTRSHCRDPIEYSPHPQRRENVEYTVDFITRIGLCAYKLSVNRLGELPMPRPGIRPTTLSGPLTSSLSSESPSRGYYVNTIHGDSVTLTIVLAWVIEPNTVQQATLDVETEQPIASGP